MITGIEQNPGMTPTLKYFLSQWLLYEHFIKVKQTSSLDQSVGRQCVHNSVAVVAFSKLKHTTMWTSLHMDNILWEGDAFTNRYIHPMISWNLKNFQQIWNCLLMISLFTKLVTYLALYVKLLLRRFSMMYLLGDAVLLLGDQKGIYASSVMYVDGNIIYLMHIVTQWHLVCLVSKDHQFYLNLMICLSVQRMSLRLQMFFMQCISLCGKLL